MKKFVFALIAVFSMASVGSAATVNMILKKNPFNNTFDLMAESSAGDNFGIASYGVVLNGAQNVQHVSTSAATARNADSTAFGAAGFTFLRSADGVAAISGSQDTIAPTPHLIRGIGQEASSFAAKGLTPLTPAEGVTWEQEFLIATGSFTDLGALTIDTANVLTVANVFNASSGAGTEGATLTFETRIVPEPATCLLAGLGLIGVAVAARRRK